MYSVGETFFYEIDSEEVELHVIGDAIIKGKEYIITEDGNNEKQIFVYDEDDDDVILIDDPDISDDLIQSWQSEYYGTIEEVGLWEEEYEEQEDDLEPISDEYYMETDSFFEKEEDFNSYIDDLMDKDD